MRELSKKEILANQFDECVNIKLNTKTVTIDCKLGLWGVEGDIAEIKRIMNEALNYWQQYKDDGEYSSIISANHDKLTSP